MTRWGTTQKTKLRQSPPPPPRVQCTGPIHLALQHPVLHWCCQTVSSLHSLWLQLHIHPSHHACCTPPSYVCWFDHRSDIWLRKRPRIMQPSYSWSSFLLGPLTDWTKRHTTPRNVFSSKRPDRLCGPRSGGTWGLFRRGNEAGA
jgi:hypothetical protein